MNRLEVGKDGKTAYERCKGKKAKVLGFEFGEKWKARPGTTYQGKMNARWGYGSFLGIRRECGEVVGADEGTKKIA